MIKKRLYDESNPPERKAALSIASYIMKETMAILHPFIPFITEEVWQSFREEGEESIVVKSWPEPKPAYLDTTAEEEMVFIQDLIGAIRNVRAEMNVPPGKKAPLYVRAKAESMNIMTRNTDYFESLAKVEQIHPYSDAVEKSAAATVVAHGAELFIPMADLIDTDKEKARLSKEIQRLEGLVKAITGKLSNENFISKAPEAVITSEKEKLRKIQESLTKLTENYQKFDA